MPRNVFFSFHEDKRFEMKPEGKLFTEMAAAT
jgi:hypothetical protein